MEAVDDFEESVFRRAVHHVLLSIEVDTEGIGPCIKQLVDPVHEALVFVDHGPGILVLLPDPSGHLLRQGAKRSDFVNGRFKKFLLETITNRIREKQ